MDKIKFTVHGEPVGKGRPRMMKSGHVYTPRKTADYEKLVRQEYERQAGGKHFRGNKVPLFADIKAYFSIPKSMSKANREKIYTDEVRPTKKPDLDNIVKSILDALNGIAYDDDSQIVTCYAFKCYDKDPRVEVAIFED